jgi:hypothetical protein
MATLNFQGTDRKVFTPISSALGALSNGPGTIIALIRTTTTGGADYLGVLNSTGSNFYHDVQWTGANKLTDDENHVGPVSTTTFAKDTTNWWWVAVDWASTAVVDRFHIRNHTSGGSWSHDPSTVAGPAAFAGPGTPGWLRIGSSGDNTVGARDIAVGAIWAGARFADSDYGTWTKTSDLYNHARGAPSFLCELNAATPVDLIAGSTYSSGNSSGTGLTGADPPTWTFDGLGAPVSSDAQGGLVPAGMFDPELNPDAWF